MLNKLEKGYVVGDYSNALVKTFSLLGGPVEVLALQQGITVTELCSPNQNLTAERYLSLLKHAQDILLDPYFGLHVGQNMDLESFHVLGKALLGSKTIGDALQQVLSLEGFVHTLGFSEVIKEHGSVRLVWHCHYQQHPMSSVLVESVLAGIIEYSQQLAGRSIPILKTTFIHTEPEALNARFVVGSKANISVEYGRVYRSQCEFSQRVNSVVVADDVLAWPNKLYGSTGQFCQHSESEFIHSVESYIRDSLILGDLSMTDVAKYFHLTIRTFQRRLAAEGSSFKDILLNTRITLAQDYLKYSNLSALEISQLLGFKEQTSFNHFFLEQLSVSPLKFRQQFNGVD